MTEIKYIKKRLKKVETILVSQPRPSKDDKSPFYKLSEKYNLKIDFRPFEKLDPVSPKEFRKQKINILEHTAIIFTSRNAVDYFFKLAESLKVNIPTDMKYFCVSEQTANYLQKYIVIRKRKIFVGNRTPLELLETIKETVKKFPDEKFLFPCSAKRKKLISSFLEKNNLDFSEAIIYKGNKEERADGRTDIIIYNTIPSDLSDLKNVFYDLIVFYSPTGIHSLFENFPDFKQNNTRIAGFGPTTAKAISKSNLILDIKAPLPIAPSMVRAVELYVKASNKIKN